MSKRVNNKRGNRAIRNKGYGHPTKCRGNERDTKFMPKSLKKIIQRNPGITGEEFRISQTHTAFHKGKPGDKFINAVRRRTLGISF